MMFGARYFENSNSDPIFFLLIRVPCNIVALIRMHMHAGSSPDWGTVRTGPLASFLTPSFFVLSSQYLKMRVLGVDVEA